MTKKQGLRPRHYFTIAVGASIGVGWIPMYGIWLAKAGAIGVALAFFVGVALMVFVASAYLTVARELPTSGGETTYAYSILGRVFGYFTGWLLAFTYLAICIFEAIAVALFAGELLPSSKGPVIYTLYGTEVGAGEVAISVISTVFIAFLHLRGVEIAANFQDILTFLLLAISAAFVAIGLATGIPGNLSPFFVFDQTGWPLAGLVSVFAAAPLLVAGFNFSVQVIGERADDVSIGAVARALFLSVFVVGLFYVGLFFAAAMSLPRETLIAANLPVAAAFSQVFGSEIFGKAVFVIALLGLFTTWNGVLLGLIKILAVLAEKQDIPKAFAYQDPETGVYRFSIVFVSALTLIGAFGGEGMLPPIIGSASITITAAYCVVALCALQTADHTSGFRSFSKWVALIVSMLLFVIAFTEPFISNPYLHLPVTWLGLLIWFAVGLGLWIVRLVWGRRSPAL